MDTVHDVIVGNIWLFCGLAMGICWGFILGTFTERWIQSSFKKWLDKILP